MVLGPQGTALGGDNGAPLALECDFNLLEEVLPGSGEFRVWKGFGAEQQNGHLAGGGRFVLG